MDNKIFLTVVIPAFNEAKNYRSGSLNQVIEYFNCQKYTWEIILVDDGSFDETPKFLKEFVNNNNHCRYIRIPHSGKFSAVKRGVMKAKGRLVLFTDFDQATPVKEFEKMLPEFDQGADIVIASRYQPESQRIGGSFLNHLKSKSWNKLTEFFLGSNFKDSSCGFKAFKTSQAQNLFKNLIVHKEKEIKNRIPFMGCFDLELIFIAQKQGLKIVSIPVIYHFKKTDKLTFWEPLNIVWVLLKIWIYNYLGFYNKYYPV